MRLVFGLLVALAGLSACASTIPGQNAGGDAGGADTSSQPVDSSQNFPLDGGQPPPTDAGPVGVDLGLPPRDTGAPPRDTGAPPRDTGAPPRDTGFVTDAGAPSTLVTRYRVVAYEVEGPEGETLRFTDVDATLPIAPPEQVFRVNGVLNLSDTEFSLSVAVLVNGHVFANEGATSPEDYSAQGLTYPGTLDRRRGVFTFAGNVQEAQFATLRNGNVGLSFASSGNRYELAPDPTPAAARAYNGGGIVQFVNGPVMATPLRAALFWDLPTPGMYREDRGATLMTPNDLAPFFVSFDARPDPAFCDARLGVELCVAHLAVYIDSNRNNRFDTNETLLGLSPLSLAWRGEGSPERLSSTPFRHLVAGWQVTHRHSAVGRGQEVLAPFDSLRPLNPDIAIFSGGVSGGLGEVW